MKHLLIHPTHRRFIRLLREQINNSHQVLFTQSDYDAFKNICQRSMTMWERHKRIYRIFLNAVYRPVEEINKDEKVCLVSENMINLMEECFSKAEWRHLGATILSGYIVPTLQHILIKKNHKRYD